MSDATFTVYIRCRPLLRSEVVQGRARAPHRQDTNFSCLRIEQQKSSSYSSSNDPLYIGLKQQQQQKQQQQSNQQGARKQQELENNMRRSTVVHVLDPDAALGPSVRCCLLHNESMLSEKQQQPLQRCIFERRFESDGVFGPDSSNSEIYQSVVRPLIEDAETGYHGTLVCHGTTNSGKTYTIFGDGGSEPGIVEYAIRDLCAVAFFNKASTAPATTVHVSFVEIYNERVVDLLAQKDDDEQTQRLQKQNFVVSSSDYARQQLALPADAHVVELVEGRDGAVMSNARDVLVTSEQQIADLLALGSARRTSASTAANSRSSRSSAVVTLRISRRYKKKTSSCSSSATLALDDQTTISMSLLTFVDLAGSERNASVFSEISASEARLQQSGGGASSPQRQHHQQLLQQQQQQRHTDAAALVDERLRREGAHINKSLFALGACIAALAKQAAEAQRNPLRQQGGKEREIVIPYRNSKLTRLLRDSLSPRGNTRTVILACCSPSVVAYSETLSTLRFAEQAREARRQSLRANRVRDESGDAMRQLYQSELVALKQEVATLRSVTSSNASKIQQQQQRELMQKRKQQQEQQQQQQREEETDRRNVKPTMGHAAKETAERTGNLLPPQSVSAKAALQAFPSFFQHPQHPAAAATAPPSLPVRTLKSFLLEEPQCDEPPQCQVVLPAAGGGPSPSLPPPRAHSASQPRPQPQQRRSPSVSFVSLSPQRIAEEHRSVSTAVARHHQQQQHASREHGVGVASSNSRNSISSSRCSIGPETVAGDSVSELRERTLSPPFLATSEHKQQQHQNRHDGEAAAEDVRDCRSARLPSSLPFPRAKAIQLCDLMLKNEAETVMATGDDCSAPASWAAKPTSLSSIFLASPRATATAAHRHHVPSWMAAPKEKQQQQQQQTKSMSVAKSVVSEHLQQQQKVAAAAATVVSLVSPFIACSYSSPLVAAAASSPPAAPSTTAAASSASPPLPDPLNTASTPLLRVKEILEREQRMRRELGLPSNFFLSGAPRWPGEL